MSTDIIIVRNLAIMDCKSLHERLSIYESYHRIVRKDPQSGSPQLFECRNGKTLVLDTLRHGFTGEVHYGQTFRDRGFFDRNWIAIMAKHVHDGELLIDMGEEFFRIIKQAAWSCRPSELRSGKWTPIPVTLDSTDLVKKNGKGKKERIAA